MSRTASRECAPWRGDKRGASPRRAPQVTAAGWNQTRTPRNAAPEPAAVCDCPDSFRGPVDLSMVDRLNAWFGTIARIPKGQVRTYGDIARESLPGCQLAR